MVYRTIIMLALLSGTFLTVAIAGEDSSGHSTFPPLLESYGDSNADDLFPVLLERIKKHPLNLWATVLFFGAIVHTFLTHRFRHIAHLLEESHKRRLEEGKTEHSISASSRIFHFLGELEAVFGIWVLPLVVLMNVTIGTGSTVDYIEERVKFTEAVFVVVIMTIASTRPILQLAENILRVIARTGKETAAAWWVSILLVGPLLGSLITEPAAMTICSLLLSQKFFPRLPSRSLAYASLGLLFVTISIGGTLTDFAAPPVLMVAGVWGWDTWFMLTQFGWKAIVAVVLSVALYRLVFAKELRGLRATNKTSKPRNQIPIPLWVTAGHVLFMVFTVTRSHDPASLIFILLFFLAFVEVTEDFQQNFSIRPPILVGFFLAGLVVHGGLQQWWIAPVLGRLTELPLFLGATILTAFNDNAAITYLCTLVPTFTDGMKYAAVAGAVTGGGLTVIANAPNPAGASILSKHFEGGISAIGLVAGAAIPTVISALCFLLL